MLCPTAVPDLSALNIFHAIKSQLLTHFQMEGNGGFPEYFKVNTEKCSFSTQLRKEEYPSKTAFGHTK